MINYIAGDPDGSVWIGTGGGLSHFSGSAWTNYTTANGLPADMISYIRADDTGNVWIGTWLGGLAKFNGS
jgi:ligand-binding sensor domain-containing protein